MASDTDTVPIVMMTPAEMRWLYHALGSFYARNDAESKCRDSLRESILDIKHGNQPEYAVPFVPCCLIVARWAAEDGACRGDERLIRGRLRERFEKVLSGGVQ